MKILKFGAVWCPGCLVMRPVWKKVMEEFPNIDVIEYDYDMDEEEVEKYNIGTKLPVIIMLDDNGVEVKRVIGEKTKEEITEFLRS